MKDKFSNSNKDKAVLEHTVVFCRLVLKNDSSLSMDDNAEYEYLLNNALLDLLELTNE